MPGPAEFTQPLHGAAPFVDGVQLQTSTPIQRSPRHSGASILGMVDGSAVIQLDYRATDAPDNPAYYQWAWTQRASQEADWLKIEEARATGRAVWFIPHTVERDVFVAEQGATALKLSRFIAKSKESSFDDTSYPNTATLNGVAQTIISSGTPTAGQVKLVGRDVTTPALSSGDKLIVTYYPAYAVVFPNYAENLLTFNRLDRTVVAVETARQVPS